MAKYDLSSYVTPETPGFVYFVQSYGGHRVRVRGLIKIGFSLDIEKRLVTLQAMSPVALRRMAFIPGSYEDEAFLHKKFREHRHHGEWFRPHEQILRYVALHGHNWSGLVKAARLKAEADCWL